MSSLKLDWANRTDMQKIAFVVSGIVVICAILCVISNIAISVEADKNGWFAGNLKQRILYFVNRAYAIIFSVLIIVAEFYHIPVIQKYAKMLKFYFVRGSLQVFVGIYTTSSDLSPATESQTANALSGLGWALVATGGLHLILALACFKEYNIAAREGDIENMAPGASVDSQQMDGSNSAAATSVSPTGSGTGSNSNMPVSIPTSTPSTASPTYPASSNLDAYRI